MALLPLLRIEIFTMHHDFEKNFHSIEHLSSSGYSHMLSCMCSIKESEHLSCVNVYVQFVHDVIAKISLSARDKPMPLVL